MSQERGDGGPEGAPQARVTVVVLNYGSDADELLQCVGAAAASEGAVVAEVVLIDNGSRRNAGAVDVVASALSGRGAPVRVVRYANNHGFAGGVNRSLQFCRSELVFLLNSDAVVTSTAIAEAVRVLDAAARPNVVGAVCKMLISESTERGDAVIDSMGMAVNPAGEAFNIGLGQPDIGQYDQEGAPSFGPCFGAALFRRDAFNPGRVGTLREHYFLYYEDVEWNWRANMFGYQFVSAPTAVVHHQMSTSTRHLPYDYKFRLIERNLLLTAAELCGSRRAMSIWFRRGLGLARGAVTGRHYPRASLLALAGALRHLPRTLIARRAVNQRRVTTDVHLFRFAAGERTFYDAVDYRPTDSVMAREFAEKRLQKRCQDHWP